VETRWQVGVDERTEGATDAAGGCEDCVSRAPKMLSATRMSMKASVSDVVMLGMNGRKINRQQKGPFAGIPERDKAFVTAVNAR
jgi:hypothetical protein